MSCQINTNIFLALYTTFTLFGCASKTLQESGEVPLLEDFTLLKMPRASLPIGAMCRPGIGLDGPGLDHDRLSSDPAPAGLETSTRIKRDLALQLGAALGLSADAQHNSKIEIRNLKISKVKNLVEESFQPDNQILYEAIHAGEISFTYHAGASTQAAASAILRAQSLGLSIASTSTEETVLTGHDLFIAYRIVAISQPKVKSWKTKSQSAENIRIGGYELSINLRGIYSCNCDGGPAAGMNGLARHNWCFSNVSIPSIALNNRTGGVGAGGKEILFNYHSRQSGLPNWVTLDTRSRGNTIEVDRLRYSVGLSSSGSKCGLVIQGYELNKNSTFELRTITYRFSHVQSPNCLL